jgi:hypothetical protein
LSSAPKEKLSQQAVENIEIIRGAIKKKKSDLTYL